ncbi:MAG: hypothetical protein AAFY56_08470, partial [Pseudomonadota bacterium]
MSVKEHTNIWANPNFVERTWTLLASPFSTVLGRAEPTKSVESFADFVEPSAPSRAELRVVLPADKAYFVETDVRTKSTRNKKKLALAGDIPASPSRERSIRLHKSSDQQQSRLQSLILLEATLNELE